MTNIPEINDAGEPSPDGAGDPDDALVPLAGIGMARLRMRSA